MRKTLSISLFFIFFYHSIGHFLLMGASLCAWKEEAKSVFFQNLEESTLIKIPKNQVTRLFDDGKEFELEGQRYDIVKTTASDFLCWKDVKESQLLKKLFQSVIQKETKKSGSDFSIFKDLIKIYFIDNQFLILNKINILSFFNSSYSRLLDSYLPSFFVPPSLFN